MAVLKIDQQQACWLLNPWSVSAEISLPHLSISNYPFWAVSWSIWSNGEWQERRRCTMQAGWHYVGETTDVTITQPPRKYKTIRIILSKLCQNRPLFYKYWYIINIHSSQIATHFNFHVVYPSNIFYHHLSYIYVYTYNLYIPNKLS